MTGYLATRGGFLPLPLVITEPALGFGGGLGAIFFHGGNPLRAQQAAAEQRRMTPPSISGAVGFATENGSKGGAAAHFGVWRDDHIRYVGIAGAASLNLDYWGLPSRPLEDPFRYNVEGALIIQRMLFRLGDSPLMLGGEWSWSTQRAEFDALSPPDQPARIDQDDSGVGMIAEYETLDNILTPRRGLKLRLLAKVFSEALGGDNDRQTLDAEGFGYVPIGKRVIAGFRGDLTFSDGDTPFYLLPYLNARGLPALKYLGKHAALAETEIRWNVRGRWTAVGFGAMGITAESTSDLRLSDGVGTYGAGFRYLLAEGLGLQAGVDYARGPDDDGIYIIVGSSWR